MARIRTLKPNHGINKKVGKLQDRAYRVWVNGLVTQADDHGRLIIDLEEIKILVYSYHKKISEKHLLAPLAEIEAAGLLDTMEKDRKIYGQLHDWEDHQKVSHPQDSVLPSVPEHSRTFQNILGERKEGRNGLDLIGRDKNADCLIADSEFFEKLWKNYPRKLGKDDALANFRSHLDSGVRLEDFTQALDNYIAHLNAEKTEDKFILHGSTWFNKRWRDYLKYKGPAKQAPGPSATAKADQQVAEDDKRKRLSEEEAFDRDLATARGLPGFPAIETEARKRMPKSRFIPASLLPSYIVEVYRESLAVGK